MSQIRSAILGLVVGDALGVPVEFQKRERLRQDPVVGMRGFGTHNQPAGTWSDDSSLALCLADVLANDGFDLEKIAQSFQDWYFKDHWTPHGRVFDIGGATRDAIQRLKSGVRPDQAGGFDEFSNGNGSLMRILPLLFYSKNLPTVEERFEVVRAVSSLTHAHIRSVLCCFYYLELANLIASGVEKHEAYATNNHFFKNWVEQKRVAACEVQNFQKILDGKIHLLNEAEIRGSGYVLHSLEASLWCVLTSENYRETVLKAVNLGEDTDTTGAIAGGLAGLVFGEESIPVEWIEEIARLDDINKLIEKLEEKYPA